MNPHLLNIILGRKSGLAAKVAAILRKYGTDAHVYLPGIGVINGLTAGNYLDSAGTTAATVDNPVGLVVDSGGINAIQATTANKPILRRGAVNLLTYSEQFDNAAWGKFRSTITPNAINAPDGTLSADSLFETVDSGTHIVAKSILPIIGEGTVSIYAKANTRTWMSINTNFGSNLRTYFDLQNGVIGSNGHVSASITSVENGWYRCSVRVPDLTLGAREFGFETATGNLGAIYAGDITKSIYLWGAQLEKGSTASTYIPTTTAAASSPSGNYHWVHDSTDILTATFPAGYESVTIIDTPKSGQVTLTAQNIVGAYNIGPSIDTYGRFIFKTIEASELAIVQSFCNRLAGV